MVKPDKFRKNRLKWRFFLCYTENMTVIAPNSEIYLIKCPLELDNLNQLSFSNATAQHNYFNGLTKLSLANATFQRKDGTIRWPGSMESILGYNYCMYRNKSHGNKWFYAFITGIEYVNDNMSSISIKTDVWQTWQFDLSWKRSYVEREHVNDDTIGAHTIPEGLDTGEYVSNGTKDYIFGDPDTVDGPAAAAEFMVCAQVTTLKPTSENYLEAPTYNITNSIPQGCNIIAWPLAKNLGSLYFLTGLYDGGGKGDAIVSMFIVPKDIAPAWVLYTGHGSLEGQDGFYYPASNKNATYIGGYNAVDGTMNSLTVARNSTIDGYTPKNNKLFVGPYNYFVLTNNNGTSIEYYWENFSGTPNFDVRGSLTQGCDIACYPTNSKITAAKSAVMQDAGWTEGITAGRLPQVSWLSDFYLNWEAQNGKNMAIQTGLSAANFGINMISAMVGGAASHASAIDAEAAKKKGDINKVGMDTGGAGVAGMLGSVVNFASNVANTQNTIRQAKMVPPQSKGNSNSGSLAYSLGKLTKFTAIKMSVRAEYAACIDNYFSMFGYKVNTLKIPNITGRQNWNYVKTIGCNVTADIPQEDIEEIKGMFNNGVTIWHNSATFLDYSQNNPIV